MQAISLLVQQLLVPFDEVMDPLQAGDCLLDIEVLLYFLLLHPFLQGSVSVLDHVLSSVGKDLGYLRPAGPVQLHQLQQSNILFD